MDSEDVLTLSSFPGRSARTADGRAGGVVRDLTVRLGDEHPRVAVCVTALLLLSVLPT
jgi:hypothetical protein